MVQEHFAPGRRRAPRLRLHPRGDRSARRADRVAARLRAPDGAAPAAAPPWRTWWRARRALAGEALRKRDAKLAAAARRARRRAGGGSRSARAGAARPRHERGRGDRAGRPRRAARASRDGGAWCSRSPTTVPACPRPTARASSSPSSPRRRSGTGLGLAMARAHRAGARRRAARRCRARRGPRRRRRLLRARCCRGRARDRRPPRDAAHRRARRRGAPGRHPRDGAAPRAATRCEGFTDARGRARRARRARASTCWSPTSRCPGLDGLEVLRARARGRRPTCPVILMTAHATVATAVAALRDGAFDYVEKPFDNDELRARRGARARSLAARAREPLPARGARARATRAPRSSPRARRMRACSTLVRRAARERGHRARHAARAAPARSWSRAPCTASATASAARSSRSTARRSRRACSSASSSATSAAPSPAPSARAPACFERAERRHALPRRDRRDRARLPGEAAARAPGAARHARRRQRGARARRPRRRRHQPRPAREVAAGALPRGPLLPPRRDPDPAAAAARAAARTCSPLARHFFVRAARGAGSRRVAGWSPEVEALPAPHAWPGNVRELENAIERGVVLARGDAHRARRTCCSRASRRRRPAATAALADWLDQRAAERIREVLSRRAARAAPRRRAGSASIGPPCGAGCSGSASPTDLESLA